MFEKMIFFFRKKKYLYYSGLLVFTSLYSYILALYFLDLTEFEKEFFYLLFVLSLGWLIVSFITYIKNSKLLQLEREKEKFYIFEEKITNDYNLNRQNNIFKKIEFIKEFVKNNFNEKGLFSINILLLINKTLNLYIENLNILINLESSLKLTNDFSKAQNIEAEIKKNNMQNENILNHLDNYIHELTEKNTNDEKVSSIESELEHTLNILKDISKR
ncbi:hypothetical protein [Halarcobacter sp.]|uniref:hypothetical protein n=1 Tax=Halarcobacter sp. TaxID=2321133 RepID=UPI0029F5C70B|nr:hypothetical protein [Halarcobacter sp.]